MADTNPPSPVPEDYSPMEVPVSFAGETHTFTLDESGTLDDLTEACELYWGAKMKDAHGEPVTYDWQHHKFIAPPPVGLLRGNEDHAYELSKLFGKDGSLKNKRQPVLRLMTSPALSIRSMQDTELAVRRREERMGAARLRRHAAYTTTRRGADAASPYTFGELRPLPHMPHPERSLAFLQRLRDDAGIRHAMKTHQFTVGLLTEMDPAMYTESSHEGTSRTLGLNRNQGQIIELRLRTDAGDGYRDYATVRRTLCHELAHNVHGPHDHKFWTLCHQIEREVERADYRRSGRTLLEGDFYEPPAPTVPETDHTDAGGWTGGTFVLGGNTAAGPSSLSSPSSRRELAARAAEQRLQRSSGDRSQASGDHEGSEGRGGPTNE